ncbi:hypothetical protein PINS_up010906 [Pythium insidiosum]|nr:hypothetical protein PINS_up010906 [Pythium insidiosum]
MGACGSRDVARNGDARDPSRWHMDDGSDASASADAVARDQLRSASCEALALNTFAAFRHNELESSGALQHCVTGWEDGSIKLTHWQTASVVKTWTPHSRAVNRLLVGGQRHLIYSCSRDTTVAITAPEHDTAAPLRLSGHSLNVSSIAVDDEESTLCSGGRDTQTILWDLATQQVKARNTTAQNVVTCAKWIPLERVVAQGSEDLSVKLWDERTALRAPAQVLRGYVYFPLCLDVSRDGLFLLTSSKGFNGVGGEVRVWDRRMARQLLQFEGHQQDATACCFLPAIDDAVSSVPTPVSASKDGTIKVWDVMDPPSVVCEERDAAAEMYTCVASMGGGVVLASAFGGSVHALRFDASARSLERV